MTAVQPQPRDVAELPPPFMARSGTVFVKLGSDIDWTCLTRAVSLEPTVEDATTVDSFCGPITLSSGRVTWMLNLGTWYAGQPGGTEDVLRPLADSGQPIDFELEADGWTVTGQCVPQQFTWGGDANSLWEIDLAWPVNGTPVFTRSPGGSAGQLVTTAAQGAGHSRMVSPAVATAAPAGSAQKAQKGA